MSDLLLCNLRLAKSCRGDLTCNSLVGEDDEATLAMTACLLGNPRVLMLEKGWVDNSGTLESLDELLNPDE